MEGFLNKNSHPIKKVTQKLFTHTWKNGFKYLLLQDDLTTQDTHAIVNAANNELWLGGGVAGAIRKKGGDAIQEECKGLIRLRGRSFDNGDVVETGIGKFKNENLKYIFHAVGPIYYEGTRNEKEDLTKAFKNCFLLGDKLGIQSLALPPISSGIFGYPKDECAEVFYETLDNFVKEKEEVGAPLILNEVRMTIIDSETFNVFVDVHKKFTGGVVEINIEIEGINTESAPEEVVKEEFSKEENSKEN